MPIIREGYLALRLNWMFGENDDEVALGIMRKEPLHIRAVGDTARERL